MWIVMTVFAIIAYGLAKSFKSPVFKGLAYFAAFLLTISAIFNALSDPWFIFGIIALVSIIVGYKVYKHRRKARKDQKRRDERNRYYDDEEDGGEEYGEEE